MSFSNKVKEELLKVVAGARHCRIAELAALIYLGAVRDEDEKGVLIFENTATMNKATMLVKKLFSRENEIKSIQTGSTNGRKSAPRADFGAAALKRILETVKLKNWSGKIIVVDNGEQNTDNIMRNDTGGIGLVCTQTCCKRAFLRGAFLACGSVSDPSKDYHLEFVLKDTTQAEFLKLILKNLDIDAGMVMRKSMKVVYIKDSEMIATLLTLMDAPVALMELENIRILKEVRNDVNRRVNCETANIDKTVKAASRQAEDIMLVKKVNGFDNLSDELRQTARLRLSHPDVSLSELAALHHAPVSRSGINHRLRRLSEMADRIREAQNKPDQEGRT